ncbi:MAG TPA: helix-turn-helix domain-containing protein, partial [Chloroflexota bacterium]|nr:helix-turn-helix domain-containing protein [Chloroflexota bacterium]
LQYLRAFVGQLRKKLGDSAARPHFILTEPGVGYRLRSPDWG